MGKAFSSTFVESLLKPIWCYLPLFPYLVMFEHFFGLGENDPSSKTLSQLAMSTVPNKIGLESKLKPWTQSYYLIINILSGMVFTLLENAWDCTSQEPVLLPELCPPCYPLLTHYPSLPPPALFQQVLYLKYTHVLSMTPQNL